MKAILSAVLAVGLLACQGCMTYAKVNRTQSRILQAQLAPDGRGLYVGVDVSKIGLAETWKADPSGTALAIGGDLLTTAILLGGAAALYNDYQDDKDSPGRKDSQSDEQRGNDSQQGSGGNGDTENRDTTVHQDGDNNTIIINQGNGE